MVAVGAYVAVGLAVLAFYHIYPFVWLLYFYLPELQYLYLENCLVGRTGDQVHEEQKERCFGGWMDGICDRTYVKPVLFEFFMYCV
jgi:hypothetical protein